MPVVDPFISSLDRIRDSDVVKQMWMGDKFQSRDSYLVSNQERLKRWKARQKYSSVPVDETWPVFFDKQSKHKYLSPKHHTRPTPGL